MTGKICRSPRARILLRDRINPWLIRRFKVGVAPDTRWLAGQRTFLIKDLNITTVLDLGAYEGQYGQQVRRGGFTGEIHSFEPGAEPWPLLSDLSARDPRWFSYRLALGAQPGEATFRSWVGGSPAASLRQPSPGMLSMMGEPLLETVPVTTMAVWLREHPEVDTSRSLLKIDVQGYEREVILGCADRLSEFPAVEIEASLGELYEGSAGIAELVTILDTAGFVPATVITERFHTGWRGAADVDVIAVRRDLSRLPV